MNTPDYIVKLHGLAKALGQTQVELAQSFGVTQATFNRWWHQKVRPHPRHIQEIEARYERVSFYARLESGFDPDKLKKKFAVLKNPGALAMLKLRRDLYDDILLKLTYNTNKIEGSTLTLRETQTVLFDNQVVANHPMIEHLEVTNHRLAFARMIDAAEDGAKIDPNFILEWHRILMSGILPDAGAFRSHPVRIVGSRVVPPNPLKVADKMRELCAALEVTRDPIGIVMQHAWFEAIHPFSDGNGRLGRLITNLQFLRAGYPPLVIRSERKSLYYDALEAAQTKESYAALLEFICEELEESAGAFF